RAALDQGQDIFALLQADEEVAVLGASDDTMEVTQAPQPDRRQKGFQFVLLKWREYGHRGSCLDNRRCLPAEDFPRRDQHVRLVGTNEIAIAIGPHQEIGLAVLGSNFHGVEKTVYSVLLHRATAFLTDGHVRLTVH